VKTREGRHGKRCHKGRVRDKTAWPLTYSKALDKHPMMNIKG